MGSSSKAKGPGENLPRIVGGKFYTEADRLEHVEAAGNASYDQGLKDGAQIVAEAAAHLFSSSRSEPQRLDPTKHVYLFDALLAAGVEGAMDVASRLGKVYLSSVDFWCPTHTCVILSKGKTYKFRDRFGIETEFVA